MYVCLLHGWILAVGWTMCLTWCAGQKRIIEGTKKIKCTAPICVNGDSHDRHPGYFYVVLAPFDFHLRLLFSYFSFNPSACSSLSRLPCFQEWRDIMVSRWSLRFHLIASTWLKSQLTSESTSIITRYKCSLSILSHSR